MNGRNVIAAAFREVLPDLPELADIRLANAIVESVDVLVFDALRQALSLVPLEQRVETAEALAGQLTAALSKAAAVPSAPGHLDDPTPTEKAQPVDTRPVLVLEGPDWYKWRTGQDAVWGEDGRWCARDRSGHPPPGHPPEGYASAQAAAVALGVRLPVDEAPADAPQIGGQVRYQRMGSLVYLLEPSRDSRGRVSMRNRITARVEALDSGEAEIAAARFRRSAEVEDAARTLIHVMHKRGIHLPETAALLATLSHDPSE